MKRSLLLVAVVVIALTGVVSLATFFSVTPALAVPVADNTADAPVTPPAAAVITEPHILLTKNYSYYDAANVSIVDVTSLFIDGYQAWDRYQGGEFDTISPPSDIISDVKISPYAAELYTTTKLATNYYGFSNDVSPFDDPLVRAAFASAIDRQHLISVALGGDEAPALTFTPPGAFGHVDGFATGIGRPYSPALAMSLLTASSYYPNIPTITMMVNDNPGHITMAEAARQEWFNTLGISVTLVVTDWGSYLDLLNNGAPADRPGIFRLGWAADYPDANNFMNDAVIGNNWMRYYNPSYDAAVFAAATEMDPAIRSDLYEQAESYLVMTDTAMAPIYYYVGYDLTRPTLNRTYRPSGGQRVDEWFFPVAEPLEVAWGEPWSLDPVFADNFPAIDYVNQLFLGLTDFDPLTGAVVPELATGWDVSPDGMVYTFTMRSDAFWTDGNPVTAYDAEYGIQRALDPNTGAGYSASLLYMIMSVQALDATHVRFDLSQPTPYFPMLMTVGPARPQPQWAIDTYGPDWAQPSTIVSNGPYQLVDWVSAPHLRVSKVGDGPPAQGSNLGFRIQYWNDGGAPADNVVITDTLMSGMTYISDSSPFTHTGTGTGPNDPLVWDLGTLPPFSFGEFEVFVQVTAVQSATITNTVQITTSTPGDLGQSWEQEMWWNDFVLANDTHLNINKWLDSPFLAPGLDATYVLDVNNGYPWGSTASSFVTITDTLHPSLTLKSWWSAGNYWWDSSLSVGQDLVFQRPSLPGFGGDQIWVVVNVDPNAPPGLMIDNTAVVTASNDLEPEDNQAIWIDNVVEYTDLLLTKSAYPDPVVQGNLLTYTLSVYNNGPVTATNVVLTDTLPSEVTFVTAIPGSPICMDAPGELTCYLGDIPPGEAAFVTATVTPDIPGEIFNYAEVGAFEYDPNPSDNYAGWATFVAPLSTDPIILDIAPNYGFNDGTSSFTVIGLNFQPGTVVALDQTALPTVTFVSDMELQADIPLGVPPDTYDVWVMNPDSATDVLLDAFTVLSPQPPTVLGVYPPQGPNDIPVTIDIFGSNFADGGFATLHPGFIPLDGLQFINSSHLRAVVPQLIPAGVYTIEVANPDESSSLLPDAYEAIDPTVGTDLYANSFDFWRSPLSIRLGDPITPQIGLDVRRQGGVAPLPSVSVDFYLGAPGGTFIGRSQALTLPPNEFRSTIPLEWTPTSAGDFVLYAVIDPDDDWPETIETNNIVSRTITVLPPFPFDTTPPDITSFTVNDGATSTGQRQVLLDVTATDTGSGVESVLYVEYEYVQSSGDWIPVQMSDWMPYAGASVDYPWALLPSPGVHYLQAWVADASGNVSAPAAQLISLLPDSIFISAGQVHVYRKTAAVGDGFQVRLTILDGGIADFYVWAPDATLVEWHEGVNSVQVVNFTAAQDGVYQIEVEGQTNALYQLDIVPTTGPAADPPSMDEMALDGALGFRGRPFLLPDDEPGDDVGLPSAPSNDTSIMLPIIMKD